MVDDYDELFLENLELATLLFMTFAFAHKSYFVKSIVNFRANVHLVYLVYVVY